MYFWDDNTKSYEKLIPQNEPEALKMFESSEKLIAQNYPDALKNYTDSLKKQAKK